jgi:NADH-ubiquinone oxidoreductase chain 5
MEGPTPVSALIHAATMVTAGVFLVIKCSILFETIPVLLTIITLIGATTAFFSATIGLVQNDIKKVIAYSTCSQLGYMFFVCGLSGYNIALFHVINHAFFKALLFLSAGAIIHSVSSEQDMRKYGGLLKLLPLTYTMLFIGSLALMGFPFTTGYYSKDFIIEFTFARYTLSSSFSCWLGLITAFLTAFYSFRLLYLTFFDTINMYKQSVIKVHETIKSMSFVLLVLCIGSIFLGYFFKEKVIGFGTKVYVSNIVILNINNQLIETEFVPF